MKNRLVFTVDTFVCLLIAVGAYFWANNLMDSLYSYRSPLHLHPPAFGQALGQPLTRRVVFILIDSLRLDTASDQKVMPFLNELRQKGAWAIMHSRPPSYSQPGYSTLLTGAWPDINDGPVMNIENFNEIPTWSQDNLISSVYRAGMKTAISAHYWFEKLIPQASVNVSFYTLLDDREADRQVLDAAFPWLESGDYSLTLIHFDQVDYAGHHEGGPRDQRWDEAARQTDVLIKEIAESLDLAQDTLLVVSDHGQIDRGGHGGHETVVLTEPFLLVGAGIRAGNYGNVNMVDVAPTIAAMLGANIPASSQGHVLTELLKLSDNLSTAVQTAIQEQQSQLLQAYQQSIGREATLQPGSDPVTTYQAALEQARQALVHTERRPRALLVAALFILATFILYRLRGRQLLWMMAGSLLYILVFNAIYVLIGNRSYSLSSLISAADLIIFTTCAVLVGLVAGWLLVAWKLKLFQSSPITAASSTLGFIVTTLLLLTLPIAWSYILNGAIITWTLPDFASSFMAFLSLVQIMLVAIIGLLLSMVTALVALLRTRKPIQPVL